MERGSSGGFLLFVALILGGLYLFSDSSINQAAPAFSLPEAYGGTVDLETYRGRPVLLAFWSTSCGICRRELPLLSQMAPEFRGKHIALVAIHLGDPAEARDYMRANGIDMTSLVDTQGTVAHAYRVTGIPKLVLIGSDGKIKRTSAGMADEGVLREWMGATGL